VQYQVGISESEHLEVALDRAGAAAYRIVIGGHVSIQTVDGEL
jgi:hypothetical protein